VSSSALVRPVILGDQQLPAPPQQQRSRRARDGLLAAALALFAENGYGATTVHEISRRAGIAVGGLYLHFRSKRQVLLVLMDVLVQDVDAQLETLGDSSRFAEQLLRSLHFASSNAGVYRAWREAALRDASIAALDAGIQEWTAARIAAALRRVSLRPWARPSVDIDSFAWMLSVLWWRSIEGLRLDRDAIAKTAAALVQSVMSEDRVSET